MDSIMHKAIAIPIIETGHGPPKFLIVKDKRYNEWTFVTGGCRMREVYNPIICALRELEEETRGIINIKRGLYTYFSFFMEFNIIEKARYHVYLIRLHKTPEELNKLVDEFYSEKDKMDSNKITFRKNYDENDDIMFLELDEIPEKCSNVWKLISDNVLNSKKFYDAMNQDCKSFHVF